MRNILIIGKRSFIGSNLKKYLSKYFNIDIFSYEKIIFKNEFFFEKYSHVINTSIHPYYQKRKYNKKFDLDVKFIKKFKQINFIYIFLNSRKIYQLNEDIIESSKKKPKCNYGKNKLISERWLKKTLKKKLLSLRISNVIGTKFTLNKRQAGKLFYDNFLELRKIKKRLVFNNDFKDFITIDQLSKIIKKLIQNNINGIFNVSLGEKVYLSEMVYWLDKEFSSRVQFNEERLDSFTLSNKKLTKTIDISINKNQLKKFCKKLIKNK